LEMFCFTVRERINCRNAHNRKIGSSFTNAMQGVFMAFPDMSSISPYGPGFRSRQVVTT
jgi:hypothetical protein